MVEFPILAQWGDRMDFIIPFIERTDEASIREYTNQRREIVDRLDSFASSTLWLKKYLLYARSLKPDLPQSVRIILEDYLVDIAKQGVRGLPRRLEALERTAIGFAKLKLKDFVDEEDAFDTMDLFNEMLKFYKQEVNLTKNPRNLAFLLCINVLKKTKSQKWALDSLIQKVCSGNPSIDLYIGEVKKSQYNSKIKALKSLFNKHPNIQICGENPTVYAWFDKNDQIRPNNERKDNQSYNNYPEESSDVTDVTETQKKKDEIKNTKYSNCANATGIIGSITSSTTPLNIDYTSGTTAKINDKEQGCTKNLTSDASVASDDSSEIISNNKNVEKISLRHSSAALVLTNNDLEDIEDRGIENSSNRSNKSRGESA
ncbi:MAG: hypothetical protein WAM14_27390 [Candidatus Nitrosopolaris sp.]